MRTGTSAMLDEAHPPSVRLDRDQRLDLTQQPWYNPCVWPEERPVVPALRRTAGGSGQSR